MEDIHNAIRAANQKFMDAFNRRDAEGIAALYTKDAKLLPPNSEMITGTQSIEAFWQGAMSLGIKDPKLETIAIEARGDLACEVGRYTMTIQPPGSSRVTDVGKYVVVWKNEGGAWKLSIDIWNTNSKA